MNFVDTLTRKLFHFFCVYAMQYDLTILGNDEAAFETALAANNQGLKTLVVVSDTAVSAWQKTRALQHLATERFANNRSKPTAANGSSFAFEFPSYLQMELQEFSTSLRAAGVDVLNAKAEFESAGTLRLAFPDFTRPVTIHSQNTIIATGVQHTAFSFCERTNQQQTADVISSFHRLPNRVRIIGGADFGAALSACLQLCGVDTQLISRQQHDSATLELAINCGVEVADHPDDFNTNCTTSSATKNIEQQVLDCRGQHGLTEGLSLDKIAVEADEHGQLWCGRHFETWCRGVYGVGDVVGFSPNSTIPVDIQAKMVVDRICNIQQPASHIENRITV